ncbi:MAG: MFS transporter [Bdellovibrionales bacterium]|nr:MFS transporter [Bdellovibrionales bacterium]
MSIKLIFKDKKFAPLMWTQFLGALNDNLFKNALVVIITFKGISLWGLAPESIVALAGGVFILPFFLFSSLAGQLSDKFEKSKIARLTKWLEVAVMLVASMGFYFHEFKFLMLALFFMGLQSTFFGPVKYSIIPELIDEKNLVRGNAYIEVGTFLAILIGTIIGGVVAGFAHAENWIISGVLFVAFLGLLASYKIPSVSIADSDLKVGLNPVPQIWSTIKLILPNKAVFNSILGISWFWFFGAALLSILPVLTKNLLLANENVVTLFLATFTIGIAIGAVLCEKLSFDRVEIGLVPWGSLGMTVFLVDLAYVSSNWVSSSAADLLTFQQFISHDGSIRFTFDLLMISVFGGAFSVPLYTLVQERSERKIRSRVIASNNVINAFFMVISSLLLMFFYFLKLTLPQIILIYSGLNLIVAIYIYSVVPEFTLRFLSWAVSRLVYRIRVKGSGNIPQEGPALLICNHVSYIDWLILSAAIKRPVRFVMYYKFFEIPLVRYLFRHAKVIPIAGANENKEIYDQAFEIVSRELQAGELVCIFPEGELSSDGELKPFKKGIEFILKRDSVPVVPMALTGLWGSFFSRMGGRALSRMPKRILFHVGVHIGRGISPEVFQVSGIHNVTALELEKHIEKLLKEN